MKRIAIFASGSGTNFQAIVDAVKKEIYKRKLRFSYVTGRMQK